MINKNEIESYKKQCSSKLQQYFQEELISRKENEVFKDMQLRLLILSENFVRSFEYELITNEKGLHGKVVIFVKKLIRKFTRFLLKPYAEKMFIYQAQASELLGKLVGIVPDIKTLEYDLSSELRELKNETLAFDRKLSQLNLELENLRSELNNIKSD